MARILVINPNCSADCSAGIDAAIAPVPVSRRPGMDVATLPRARPRFTAGGTGTRWSTPVPPVERDPADAYVIACGSDPGIEAVRSVTGRPVFGVFRAAVAAAVARAERFGVIAIVEASKPRHMLALRAMGLEERLAAEVALNVTMEALLDPDLARARLIAAARELANAGRGGVGTGLHRDGASSRGDRGGGGPAGDRAVPGGGAVGDRRREVQRCGLTRDRLRLRAPRSSCCTACSARRVISARSSGLCAAVPCHRDGRPQSWRQPARREWRYPDLAADVMETLDALGDPDAPR